MLGRVKFCIFFSLIRKFPLPPPQIINGRPLNWYRLVKMVKVVKVVKLVKICEIGENWWKKPVRWICMPISLQYFFSKIRKRYLTYAMATDQHRPPVWFLPAT